MSAKLQASPEGRAWYRIEARGESAQVDLFDEIGQWGIGAGDFVKELREVTASTIDLHLSSPGGEVFDGLAIYAALRRHPAKVTVHIDGLAASIASVIAMAGDVVKIDRYAQMMIHEAHAVAVGATKDMAAMATLLDQYSDNIAEIYTERAGGTPTQWRERMRAETWYSADEAVKAGLADEVTGASRRQLPTSTWDLSIFNFAGRASAPDPFAELTNLTEEPVAVEEIELPETPPVAETVVVENVTPALVDFVSDAVRARGTVAEVLGEPVAFDPAAFRAAVVSTHEVDFDASVFRDVIGGLGRDMPAMPETQRPSTDLGPLPVPAAPPADLPPLDLSDHLRAAVALVAHDMPAPDIPIPPSTDDPADEPGFFVDAQAFRAALRRAHSE